MIFYHGFGGAVETGLQLNDVTNLVEANNDWHRLKSFAPRVIRTIPHYIRTLLPPEDPEPATPFVGYTLFTIKGVGYIRNVTPN